MVMLMIMVMFLGMYGVYWTNSREYNRRNAAGVEEFNGGYGLALLTMVFDGIIRLMSVLCIGFGFALACIGYGFKGGFFVF